MEREHVALPLRQGFENRLDELTTLAFRLPLDQLFLGARPQGDGGLKRIRSVCWLLHEHFSLVISPFLAKPPPSREPKPLVDLALSREGPLRLPVSKIASRLHRILNLVRPAFGALPFELSPQNLDKPSKPVLRDAELPLGTFDGSCRSIAVHYL
jgi:hypothetical protein